MYKKLMRHWPLICFVFIVVITVIIIQLSGKNVIQYLRYDAKAITDQQEYWRLLTAHVTHLGWSHLWLNVAGLAIILTFFAPCISVRYWMTSFFVSALSISLLIYFFNPEIRWYVGLSGVLHALFIVGGIADIFVRKWEGAIFTSIILAKVTYEQIVGPLPGSEAAAGGSVLVDAHFYGAMVGLVLAIPLLTQIIKPFKKHEK